MSKGDNEMARSTPAEMGEMAARADARRAGLNAEYTAKRVEVFSKLRRLNGALDRHVAYQITWGGVGDLGHVNEQLGELLEFLGEA